ncbi:interferon-induced, double-stranded RNA-activated protein kinase-like [Eleutherodactylus coqui]|uniref:interferon-induced, double-stranded RNA-activated protein kinase-like n=1 Tax=Eleutherodactylus coqui TaxID=57060 RepID=UPI003461C693
MEDSKCKALLMEFCVKNRLKLEFKIISESGPPHDRVFTCQVSEGDKLLGKAEGKTKKSAELKAAKIALLVYGIRYQPNYISMLNEFSQRKKQDLNFVEESHLGPAHNPEFTYRVKFGDSVFPLSRAYRTKKQAVKEAAYLALQELKRKFPKEIQELPEFFIDDSGSENSSLSGSAPGEISGNTSLPENGFSDSASATSECQHEQDFVSCLQMFCQKKNWTPQYVDCEADGAPHVRQFSLTVKIGSRSFPKSNMKNTKKLAKKEAAFLALKELKSEFPEDIPNLPKEFTDDSMTGHSSAVNPVKNWCIQPSSESGLDTRATPSSEPRTNSSGLISSNVHSPSRQSLSNGLNQPTTTDSGGGSLLSSNSISSDLNRAQSFSNPMDEFRNPEKLGKGAYGNVVKVQNKIDDQFYAVKKVQVLDKKVLEEVKVLARLEHQNIVRYFNARLGPDIPSDSSESSSNSSEYSRGSGTCLYIQMELCENGSLKEWIKKRNLENRVNKSVGLEIFQQIIEGVRYIHSKKLIHRDLKPANILFTKEMIVKIGDFGLVTRMTGEEAKKALERTRGTGTPSYMAPEQKHNQYENEVDIYPLGLILFELLCIFRSEHERGNHWINVRQGEFPSGFEEQYPLEKRAIRQMLSHDPKKRPSAEELSRSFQTMKTLDSQTY